MLEWGVGIMGGNVSMSITLDADVTIEVNCCGDEPLLVELVIRRERMVVRVPLPWRVAEVLANHLAVASELAEAEDEGGVDGKDELL